MGGTGLGLAVSGALGAVLDPAASQAAANVSHLPSGASGYGPLMPDPAGIVDLPRGFTYRVMSRAGIDRLDDGNLVPSLHDGMAAFPGHHGRTVLVRNHEIAADDVVDEGAVPVIGAARSTYDPNAVGGTTTLVVGPRRELVSHRVSLAGTSTNCAGGATPWGTWLTCEETDEVIEGRKHGYVFEVDPVRGGDPTPIKPMGRFEHEAVAFDHRTGEAYLTEDADGPHGLLYRFRPRRPLQGRGSLHAGGRLAALHIPALGSADLSSVTDVGTTFSDLRWIPIDDADIDPGENNPPLRERYGGTRVPKGEGAWWGRDGRIWFVSSRGDGPDAEDEDERSDGVHGGQIWSYDPRRETLRLVVCFEPDHIFEGPDNITASPYGFAVMCTDGEDDNQYLGGVTPKGDTFPLAHNRLSGDEFAGACFSPDGETLFANIQHPGLTLAIRGPWIRDGWAGNRWSQR